MAGGIKDGGDMKAAARCAHESRTAKAGTFHGGMPPAGPKREPSKLNGVPVMKDRGTSK